MASTLNVEKPEAMANGSNGFAPSDDKLFTIEQLKEHGSRESLWLLLHGKVYDVTKFLDEHPGGDEVLVEESGHDATEAFEDIGHSPEADSIMKTLYIGEFKGESKKAKPVPVARSQTAGKASSGGFPLWTVPMGLAVVYLAWRLLLA